MHGALAMYHSAYSVSSEPFQYAYKAYLFPVVQRKQYNAIIPWSIPTR